MELVKSSLFDKNYILNSILNASGLSDQEAWAEYLMVPPYSNETDKLLADGGISKKTVKQITEKSRTIKEFVDYRIANLLENFQVGPCIFIQSPVLLRVVQKLSNKYDISAD